MVSSFFQTAPICKVIQRWWKSEMACILSPLDKNVSTSLGIAYTYLLMWTCESFYSHTKLPSWSTWTLETYMHNNWTKKLSFSLKFSFDSEDEKLWTWPIEVEMSCSSFVKPFYRDRATTIKMLADLHSQTRTLRLFTNSVLMLVVSLWQVITCKNEEGSSHASTIKLLLQLSQPIRFMLSFIIMD